MSCNSRFEKSHRCPTNESLLAFLQAVPGTSSDKDSQEIVEHLATCEFCELTLELLRAHPEPVASEPDSIPPPPESLFRLFTASWLPAKRENK